MGYAEHDGRGLGATPAPEGLAWAGEDRVRYADSGAIPDSGGRPGRRPVGLPGGEPADDGPGAPAVWSPDMTTGAYPVIGS